MSETTFTPELAGRLAGLALACVQREFPYQPQHVLTHAGEESRPRRLHPAFYGCFDWHSAVHGHWLLARALRRFPDHPAAAAWRGALRVNLTAENLAAEAAYFREHPGFERPYGWGWLLKLTQELQTGDDAETRTWHAHLQPLADVIVSRYFEFLPKQTYPVRAGVHSNTAFGLAFAWDYAANNAPLRALIRARALAYFGQDRAYPWAWEPSGSDFFSPGLMEADLLRRLLPAAEFAAWLTGFLPEWQTRGPLEPVTPADRTDGQLVHLDGLNLSRAGCLWNLARALPAADERRAGFEAAAERHLVAGLAHVASGDYMGEHWLATFAMYALECAAGAG